MTFTVDIHHHILPDVFWDATNEGDSPVGGIAPPPWSRDGMLAFLDDTPDVRYVFSHAGGTVPYLAGRFGIVDEMSVIPGAERRATAAETFRHLYWDTALSWGDPVLRMLREVAGIDHVLFGTDYPYLRRDLAVASRGHILSSPELNDGERAAVLGGTAAQLIPRLAALSAKV